MRKLFVLSTLILLPLLIAPSAAFAHRITIVPIGGEEIDLGIANHNHAVHLTFGTETTPLKAKIRAAKDGGAIDLALLIPDRFPENEEKLAALPTIMSDTGKLKLNQPVLEKTGPKRIQDEATGLSYIVIQEGVLTPNKADRSADETQVLKLKPGKEPSRVVLYVGDLGAEKFATNNAHKLPRPVARLRAWFDTPAPGVKAADQHEARSLTSKEVWLPAAVSLIMLLLAVWWMRNGLGKARARGVERELSRGDQLNRSSFSNVRADDEKHE